MPGDSPLSFNETIQAITEFIEVAIHAILYVRQVYPPDQFVRRKKYDTPVFQSRHPVLNEYISGAVKAIGEELILGNVDKVVVVVMDKEKVALERFIFSIRNTVRETESSQKDSSVQNAVSAACLGQHFRSFLIKLAMIECQLGQVDLGDDASFAILLELKDDKDPSAAMHGKDPPPWIPAETTHTTSSDTELHMVRAFDTGIISLSLAVQESSEKVEMTRKARP